MSPDRRMGHLARYDVKRELAGLRAAVADPTARLEALEAAKAK